MDPGVIVAIFVAIIGSYVFTFTAWRATSNHIYSKLDALTKKVDALTVDVADRLARIETTLGAGKKE